MRSNFITGTNRLSVTTIRHHKSARHIEKAGTAIWSIATMRMFENLAHQGIKPLMIFYLMSVCGVSTIRESAAIVAVSSAISDVLAIAGGYLSQKILGLFPAMMLGFSATIIACFASIFIGPDRVYDCLACIACSYAINKSAGSTAISLIISRRANEVKELTGYRSDKSAADMSGIVYLITECGGVLAHVSIGLLAEIYGLRFLLIFSGCVQLVAMTILIRLYNQKILSELDSESLFQTLSLSKKIILFSASSFLFVCTTFFVGFLFRNFNRHLLAAICLFSVLFMAIVAFVNWRRKESEIPLQFWIFSFFYIGLMFCVRQFNYLSIPFLHLAVDRTILGFTIPTSAIVAIFPATTVIVTAGLSFCGIGLHLLSYTRRLLIGYGCLFLCWLSITLGCVFVGNAAFGTIGLFWSIAHVVFIGLADALIVPCMLYIESSFVPEKARGLVSGMSFTPAAISLFLSDSFATKFFYNVRGDFSAQECIPGFLIISAIILGAFCILLCYCYFHQEYNNDT